LIQISESMVARAIRTKEWTYCVVDRDADAHTIPSSIRYEEYQMYNNADDPAQLVNLAGRTQYLEVATDLRNRLLSLIEESGEPRPMIALAKVYP
jgi:arylsulfatase A-like enzyme